MAGMISRRAFPALLSGTLAALRAQPARRPNIVILLADDLGYGDLGCYGHPTIRTPNLDRMAAEGMRFTQVYAAAAVCTPSRAALLTGRLPIRSGLTRVLGPFSTGGIPSSEITLAEALRGAGYAAACVGKWHLGFQPPYLPTRHGFDSYFGLPYSNDMSPATNPSPNYRKAPPTPLYRNEQVIERDPDQAQLTPRYTAEALRFIRRSAQAGRPYFLYLPYTFPHVPLAASARFRGKSPRGLYGDVVEELDWSVGEILRAVDPNTIVFFSSDNGPWLVKNEDAGSAGLLREGKMSTWEGGVREPFIARWPGHIPAGVTTQAFGTLMDLFPTCVRLAGATLPADRPYDGADLSPVLFERHPGREAQHFYYIDMDLFAVRKGPWKLHFKTVAPASGQPQPVQHDPPLLFHLLHDPSERHNVADANPQVVQELVAFAQAHRASMKPGEPQR